MSRPWKRWRHVIINTYCSWLHGDKRGFRDRKHRMHAHVVIELPSARKVVKQIVGNAK